MTAVQPTSQAGSFDQVDLDDWIRISNLPVDTLCGETHRATIECVCEHCLEGCVWVGCCEHCELDDTCTVRHCVSERWVS